MTVPMPNEILPLAPDAAAAFEDFAATVDDQNLARAAMLYVLIQSCSAEEFVDLFEAAKVLFGTRDEVRREKAEAAGIQ